MNKGKNRMSSTISVQKHDRSLDRIPRKENPVPCSDNHLNQKGATYQVKLRTRVILITLKCRFKTKV